MPRRTKEEKEARRLAFKERLEAKKIKRVLFRSKKACKNERTNTCAATSNKEMYSVFLNDLGEDVISYIFIFLPAREIGAISLTCRYLNCFLRICRVEHLLNRLKSSKINLCDNESDVKILLEKSLISTKRLITRKSEKCIGADEYPAYARFIEEGVSGYCLSKNKILLPDCVNGRFVSISQEHTLCRAGGGGDSGAGGSGCAFLSTKNKPPGMILNGILGCEHRIVQVSNGGGLVGMTHSLLLTDTGHVLSFGTAQQGQLGHGYALGKYLENESRPRLIDALSQYTIICVSAGELHSAVVTEDGDVYTWGDGFCGQLGLGDKRPQLLPRQVMHGLEEECVLSVTCGHRHTLCVTEDGEVFSFGLGAYGALGRPYTGFSYEVTSNPIQDHIELISSVSLDDTSTQCVPKKLDSLNMYHIIGASSGHKHSIVLDRNGHLYTFGTSTTGALGHGAIDKLDFPMKVDYLASNHIHITQISAGVDMSIAVSKHGHVYAWGLSTEGRLGLPNNIERFTRIPSKVPFEGGKVIDAECGYIHSCLVCVDGTVYLCHAPQDHQTDQDIDNTIQQVPDFNIWHRTFLFPASTRLKYIPPTKKWTYQIKSRSQMKQHAERWNV